MKISQVDETKFGVYVWMLPDGSLVADEDHNWLSIASDEGNIKRIMELQSAAISYGINEGYAYFMRGHRKVDDEEYERQKERLKSGLIPDELDIPAYREVV